MCFVWEELFSWENLSAFFNVKWNVKDKGSSLLLKDIPCYLWTKKKGKSAIYM